MWYFQLLRGSCRKGGFKLVHISFEVLRNALEIPSFMAVQLSSVHQCYHARVCFLSLSVQKSENLNRKKKKERKKTWTFLCFKGQCCTVVREVKRVTQSVHRRHRYSCCFVPANFRRHVIIRMMVCSWVKCEWRYRDKHVSVSIRLSSKFYLHQVLLNVYLNTNDEVLKMLQYSWEHSSGRFKVNLLSSLFKWIRKFSESLVLWPFLSTQYIYSRG